MTTFYLSPNANFLQWVKVTLQITEKYLILYFRINCEEVLAWCTLSVQCWYNNWQLYQASAFGASELGLEAWKLWSSFINRKSSNCLKFTKLDILTKIQMFSPSLLTCNFYINGLTWSLQNSAETDFSTISTTTYVYTVYDIQYL